MHVNLNIYNSMAIRQTPCGHIDVFSSVKLQRLKTLNKNQRPTSTRFNILEKKVSQPYLSFADALQCSSAVGTCHVDIFPPLMFSLR